MRVTATTQQRFESLYYNLTQIYTEYTIAGMIARIIGKSIMTVYMHFRRNFSGGYESSKRQLITAMEKIAGELKCN